MIFDKLNLNSLSLGLIICEVGILLSYRVALNVEEDAKRALSNAEIILAPCLFSPQWVINTLRPFSKNWPRFW